MPIQNIIAVFLGLLGLAIAFFSYKKSEELKSDLERRGGELSQRIFELSILKEMGDRIGYFLDVQKIIDIITGSLHQLIKYSVVSYMLLEPEKVIFKAHLEKSVNRDFIDSVKDRMLQSLSALLDKEFKNNEIEETISGAIMIEEVKEPVKSFFNIPIVISNKVVGILTVADTVSGLYKEDEMTILYRIMQQASSAVTRLEDVVQTEQRKLNSMVGSITEGVIMTDTDYRLLVANPAAKEVVGLLDRQDVTIFDFIEKLGSKLDIKAKLEESIRLDKMLEAPEILINDKFYQILVSPVKSKYGLTEGKILGGVVIFHDITHDKEVAKLREDFISIMVHELRSPLDGIKKRIEVLNDPSLPKAPEKESEIMNTIYVNAAHMLELVNDLLDAAKLEAGKFEFRKEPSGIRILIQERVNFYKILAEGDSIVLDYKVDQKVPEKINMDPVRMGQVLNNLISNAIKFTETGGKITVQALLHKQNGNIMEEAKDAQISWLLDKDDKNITKVGDSVVIAVTDSGIGISQDNIGQLFNKFKQFKATAAKKEEKKGTGLGLVIAKGLAEGHGGVIGVGSEEGTGSTFYFTIPIN